MKKIYLSELRKILGLKDVRTVRRWCQTKNVFVVRRCKREYVHESILNIIISNNKK